MSHFEAGSRGWILDVIRSWLVIDSLNDRLSSVTSMSIRLILFLTALQKST